MILFLMAMVLMQAPQRGNLADGGKMNAESAKPVPLVCGKYQHEVEQGFKTCRHLPDNPPGIVTCDPKPVQCADDLHVLTEREWQELIEALKAQSEFNHQLSDLLRMK